jgi:hypothetical protein
MVKAVESVPGYTYGSAEVPVSRVTVRDLESLKVSAGFTAEDERYLHLAGEVLRDQTGEVVKRWRTEIIAAIPHLARHSRTPDGHPIPEYLARSNSRFEQWILDTCFRLYDQDWINYQQEIAARHTAPKKNTVDGVQSTPYVPLRDCIAFTAVMNDTIRRFLAAKGHAPAEVDKMHLAWCKSIQIQMALWADRYMDTPGEW